MKKNIITKIIRLIMAIWAVALLAMIYLLGMSGSGFSIEMLVFMPLLAVPVILIWKWEYLGGIIVFAFSLTLILIFDWKFTDLTNPGFISFIIPLFTGIASFLNSDKFRGRKREKNIN